MPFPLRAKWITKTAEKPRCAIPVLVRDRESKMSGGTLQTRIDDFSNLPEVVTETGVARRATATRLSLCRRHRCGRRVDAGRRGPGRSVPPAATARSTRLDRTGGAMRASVSVPLARLQSCAHDGPQAWYGRPRLGGPGPSPGTGLVSTNRARTVSYDRRFLCSSVSCT